MKSSLTRLKTAGLLLCLIFSAAIIAGCDYYRIPSEVRKSLKAAGDNKDELQAVIDHFRHDSEKLEAAYYLISNMPGHYSIGGQSVFDPAFDQIEQFMKETGRWSRWIYGELFSKLIDSIRVNSNPTFAIEEDIKTIRSDYLIENIELSFKAYSLIPAHLRCDRETFLKFVLPYRNSHEPVEPGLRKYFFQKYHWVFERMEQYGSLQSVFCDLLDSIDIRYSSTYKYPFVIPLSNTYTIGIGRNCDDMVNLVVFIFRALGIPAVFDFTPHFGNGSRTGHAWLAFIINDSTYGVEIPNKQSLNSLYKHEALPKIYRRSFENNQTNSIFHNSIDVTSQYRNSINIQFDYDRSVKKFYLKLFHKEQGWVTVDESINNRRKVIFNDVGKNNVYVIGDASDNENKVINFPFYVNNKREIMHLKAEQDNTITAILTRKFPPFRLRYLNPIRWINSINGAEIQAANKTDFSDAVTLLTIKNFNSFNKQVIKTGNKEKYRNYRLVSADSSEIHIAGFNLLKNDTIIMTDWQVLASQEQVIHEDGHNVIDNKPLTFLNDTHLSVNYYFDEPVAINEFQIQARNDDNNVKPGDHYELMYWADGWVSAGSKLANDTLLVYEDIPSGALYWLRNHTEGREEQVFLLDEKGYQYWPGVTSFKDSYHEFLEMESLCNN